MAGKAEIFVGVVNDGVTVGSGATAISDQFLVNGNGMVLLNQAAQTGAVIASVTSVTKLAGPYVPIVSMPANVVAGTITFLKIGVDIRDGAGFEKNDVISLVGNVAGVIATMAVLAAAPFAVVGTASVVSIAAGLYSIGVSKTVENLAMSAADFFRNNPADSYVDYVWAPDMKLVHRDILGASYNNYMLSFNWSPETGELVPSAFSTVSENSGGGGFVPPTNPVVPVPPPEIVPVVTIGPLEFGNENAGKDDNGDEYGCCTGGSDGYV
ncbi:hypothetical protein AN403_1924 [Pseudomonas fluorescens]|uniref:Uncharacterized protein n=1 Tax=Pseudomonas fluorescens TaxID=294 RepID=A0A0P8ZKK3_PSEFL|nr:hypothetical protein [Pseudomonas fluorescens]KPU57555.1 hypothetical protein AN403_1924 [Pseudomonas fluorescens]